MKKQILKDLAISESIYTKSLKLLSNLGLVTGSRGEYQINEEIFWKGDFKTREALLKSGCKITFKPDEAI